MVPDSTGIALIGLSGTAVVAGVGFLGTVVVEKRRALSESQKALARYSEPLIGAAYELQGRLWNILNNTFLERYVTDGDEAQKAYAVDNTLYVFAQYFGWSEILRRDIQFLSFSKTEQTRNVAKTQYEIVQDFQDDRPELGRPFLLWRGEQRAIGELMIEETPGDQSFITWLGRLEKDIESAANAKSPRLPELQNHLVDLIELLDPDGLRFDATDPDVLARSDRGAGAAA